VGTMSIWHWLIVLAVVLILFGGGGKLSRLMGDLGKGITSFKKSMKEGEEAGTAPPPPAQPRPIDANPTDPQRRDESIRSS
jgi:sec-independent protein translocase protein TatA